MDRRIVIPLVVGGLVLVILVGTGIRFELSKGQASPSPTSTGVAVVSPSPSPTATVLAQSATAGAYKDGSYHAEGAYRSPGGNQKIGVDVTVKNGTIAAVNVTAEGVDPESKEYENRFASGISSVVTGKPLDASFDVSQVNGSSLTGTGFTQALETIRTQAKA